MFVVAGSGLEVLAFEMLAFKVLASEVLESEVFVALADADGRLGTSLAGIDPFAGPRKPEK